MKKLFTLLLFLTVFSCKVATDTRNEVWTIKSCYVNDLSVPGSGLSKAQSPYQKIIFLSSTQLVIDTDTLLYYIESSDLNIEFPEGERLFQITDNSQDRFAFTYKDKVAEKGWHFSFTR